MTHQEYEKSINRVGIISGVIVLIANFLPIAYLAMKGVTLSFSTILSILGVAFATYGISWFVQPISFYTALGPAGTYITWNAGYGADIRLPAANMAKKMANVEDSTPEGDVIATIGICCSVFVSVALISVFTFIGTGIVNILPPVIIDSFSYLLPAIFGAIYVDLALKNLKMGGITLVFAAIILVALRAVGIPSGYLVLCCVLGGLLVSHLLYKVENKPTAKAE